MNPIGTVGDGRQPYDGARPAAPGRWAGMAILLGLVIVTLVVAAVRTSAVAGRATAVPVPGPPRVGGCLIEVPDAADGFGYDGNGPLPSAAVAPCDGDRYGEVVSIGPGSDVQASFDDGLWAGCWADAQEYVGLPDAGTDATARSQSTSLGFEVIGPDVRQRAVGQEWSACLIDFLTPDATAGARTAGQSLRGAWSREPGLFSMCVDGADPAFAVSCSSPHRYEQISYWVGDPGRPPAPAEQDCRTDAVLALNGAAALDRGILRIEVQYSRWDGSTGGLISGPDAIAGNEPYDVSCLLTPADPTRRLTGPLRGLGDAPVPLA